MADCFIFERALPYIELTLFSNRGSLAVAFGSIGATVALLPVRTIAFLLAHAGTFVPLAVALHLRSGIHVVVFKKLHILLGSEDSLYLGEILLAGSLLGSLTVGVLFLLVGLGLLTGLLTSLHGLLIESLERLLLLGCEIETVERTRLLTLLFFSVHTLLGAGGAVFSGRSGGGLSECSAAEDCCRSYSYADNSLFHNLLLI